MDLMDPAYQVMYDYMHSIHEPSEEEGSLSSYLLKGHNATGMGYLVLSLWNTLQWLESAVIDYPDGKEDVGVSLSGTLYLATGLSYIRQEPERVDIEMKSSPDGCISIGIKTETFGLSIWHLFSTTTEDKEVLIHYMTGSGSAPNLRTTLLTLLGWGSPT